MFYNEHRPPHFHVKYQDYDAVVDINDGVVKGTMPKRALRMIFDWMDMHREELLENWRLIEERKPLSKIEPLK
jgi:hypothetical protein